MRLAVTVTHPQHPDQDLLKAGYALTGEVIGRLREMGVEYIYVDYPELSDLDRYMAPLLSPERQVIYQQIRNTISAVQKTAQPTVAFPDYYASTRELVMTLMSQGQNCVYLDQMSGKLGQNAVAHATAVAHLSLMIGLKLETYLIQQRKRLPVTHAREVINLGVAGMLHDIGLARLPEALRHHSRIQVPEDAGALKEWQTHPYLGYEMIKGGVEATAAAAVLHHHQAYDGSGFPAAPREPGEEPRNSGQRLHVFARIIAVADLYDRLTAGPEGQRRANVEILHLMRTQYGQWLDPVIVAALPGVVPPFPPGVKVTLSDGTDAVTVGLKADRPYQPTVKRVEDKDGAWRIGGEALDLSKEGAPKIVRVAGVETEGLIPVIENKPSKRRVMEAVA